MPLSARVLTLNDRGLFDSSHLAPRCSNMIPVPSAPLVRNLYSPLKSASRKYFEANEPDSMSVVEGRFPLLFAWYEVTAATTIAVSFLLEVTDWFICNWLVCNWLVLLKSNVPSTISIFIYDKYTAVIEKPTTLTLPQIHTPRNLVKYRPFDRYFIRRMNLIFRRLLHLPRVRQIFSHLIFRQWVFPLWLPARTSWRQLA